MKVHESQAYKKMDVTRERISRIFELTEMLLSFQAGKLVSINRGNAAVVCTILECISVSEPSSDLKYLKLVTVSSFYPFTLISLLMPLVLFVISWVFSALISMP